MEPCFVTSKRDFRARAHSNPLNDADFLVPEDPYSFDWSPFIPNIGNSFIHYVDLGCGYGGLLRTLSSVFPDKFMLGMEIRDRVASYCVSKLEELRRNNNSGEYRNIGFIRTNCMKFLPFYFPPSSVEKFFICFPDPHFKKKKHRQRLVSLRFLSEAAYCLQPGGMIYIVTDVEELFLWMNNKFSQHPLFCPVQQQEDILIPYLLNHTDEAQRIIMKRQGPEPTPCYWNIFQRL